MFEDEQGRKQRTKGIGGISVSAKGIDEAEKIAQLVTGQLVAGTFTWDWFNSLIGKDTSEQTKQLTRKEMVEQYEKHYFKQREGNKTAKASWYYECSHIHRVLCLENKPLSSQAIHQIVESSNNNSRHRARVLSGLTGFLRYHKIDDFNSIVEDYKSQNKPKRKKRNVPSEERIVEIYKKGFIPPNNAHRTWVHRYPQRQFLFGLLATYGLRIHEAWNIANWEKPVTLKDGDWVVVETDDDKEISIQRDNGDLIIPAILDPNNKDYLLCIKHSTKTGFRVAFPLSPTGQDWIKEFNLIQPLNLPDIPNPLGRIGKNETSYVCSAHLCRWFREHKYGFKPHDLRHAFNHRGHTQGINRTVLCQGLGHGKQMNETTYLNSMPQSSKVAALLDTMTKNKEERSENELLKEENQALKVENTALKQEIKLLKNKLNLNNTFKESKG